MGVGGSLDSIVKSILLVRKIPLNAFPRRTRWKEYIEERVLQERSLHSSIVASLSRSQRNATMWTHTAILTHTSQQPQVIGCDAHSQIVSFTAVCAVYDAFDGRFRFSMVGLAYGMLIGEIEASCQSARVSETSHPYVPQPYR